uniref:Uncharacterized protein n=1 Tax=Rhizophora mucronata TaxID=61149 RepID=A0A2P2N3I6_RHIMU
MTTTMQEIAIKANQGFGTVILLSHSLLCNLEGHRTLRYL